ncbi:MAG: IscS subfamily cysteine desulfurase, partial [Candidatus Neomarinimicrobiota bacterium]
SPVMEYRKWEKGGLRPDGNPGFDTPTGKFEIHSTILEEYGYEPLPKYTEPSEGPLGNPDLAREYPLVFNSGARPHTDFRSQHHGIKGLNRENPEPMVEINAADAQARGISSGDLVEVHTARGTVPFRAKVTNDIVASAVECNMGGGTAVGSKAWRKWNVNELTDLSNYDEISGFPVYKALLCEVTLAKRAGRRRAVPKGRAASNDAANRQKESNRKPARRIYLDNNATTRLSPQVRTAMLPYLETEYGNPSSIHRTGRDARDAVEHARRQVAGLLGCSPRRIVFTGGGSESVNLAVKGIAYAQSQERRHIITSAIEHPANLNTCKFLERQGFEVTYLGVDSTGLVSVGDLERVLREDTALVTIIMANNEVGTIQPIKALCAAAHARGTLFHTDAVQAVGKLPLDVAELDVDLLSLSGHKFHGPKGVGALYVKKGVHLEPLIHGGRQEQGLRAGTENVSALVGLGAAAELVRLEIGGVGQVAQLRDRLEQGIRELIPGAGLNGHPEHRLPNTLNLTLPGLRGESLVVALDQHGISLSSGSACKSGSPEPTHVLLAMGISAAEAHCSVRFSLSRETTAEDVQTTLAALATVLEELETTVRFLPCK